jgi:hypothetical protein
LAGFEVITEGFATEFCSPWRYKTTLPPMTKRQFRSKTTASADSFL